jgi:hypothetical protein
MDKIRESGKRKAFYFFKLINSLIYYQKLSNLIYLELDLLHFFLSRFLVYFSINKVKRKNRSIRFYDLIGTFFAHSTKISVSRIRKKIFYLQYIRRF